MPLSWNEIKSRAIAFVEELKKKPVKTGSFRASLYDSNTMPPALVKAHQQLDKAVDGCYRPQPFINETKRIEFLFELYDRYTSGLFVKEKKGEEDERVKTR